MEIDQEAEEPPPKKIVLCDILVIVSCLGPTLDIMQGSGEPRSMSGLKLREARRASIGAGRRDTELRFGSTSGF